MFKVYGWLAIEAIEIFIGQNSTIYQKRGQPAEWTRRQYPQEGACSPWTSDGGCLLQGGQIYGALRSVGDYLDPVSRFE